MTYEEIVKRTGMPVVAVVTGVGEYQGLAVMRALGRKGIPVCAMGKEGAAGFSSRYATACWVTPDTHADPAGLMDVILAAGRELKAAGKKGVLIPTQDSMVEFVAKNRAAFAEYFICHLPSVEVIRACSDKQEQCRVADQLGVPYPRTYFDFDVERLIQDLDGGHLLYPVIFKARRELPSELRKQFRFVIVENRLQLDQLAGQVLHLQIPFVIQEIIPGEDDTLYTLGSVMNQKGEFKAVFTGRKLRQRPPRFGECRVGESKLAPEIVGHGAKLLRALNYFGISQVEFKYDRRDGKYKLMEVNPRAWSWISLPIALGINLPYAFFCDALGIDIPCQEMPDERGVYVSLLDDLYWSLKAGDGVPWLHCFKNYDLVVEPYYAKDDRKPGLVHFGRNGPLLLGMGFRKMLRAAGLSINSKRGKGAK